MAVDVGEWAGALAEGIEMTSRPALGTALEQVCAALGAGSPIDLSVLAVVLAPDVDPRRRPATRARLRSLLGARADGALDRLEAVGLVHVSETIVADAHALALLNGSHALHPRLRPSCRVVAPDADVGDWAWEDLPCSAEAVSAAARVGPVRLWLAGARGAFAQAAAAAVARKLGVPLLVVDAEQALVADPTLATTAPLLFREAWLRDAATCVLNADALFADAITSDPARALAAALAADGGVTVLAGESSVPHGLLECAERPLGVVTLNLGTGSAVARDRSWADAIEATGLTVRAEERRRLARRFGLDRDEIRAACVRAAARLRLDIDETPGAALMAAARAARSHRLAAVATRVEPRAGWDDLQLPPDTRAQLQELVDLVSQREHIWDAGGFGRSTARGRGVSALIAGASGTGKTTAAEVVAGALGLDLYRIDLAGLVSKWVGETEKNLDRVFAAAQGANAVLLFDEADAIFGKRSEIHDAHDRYANVEIAYLLQRIEDYDGVAILTSNLRHHLDEAFLRRLTCAITFPIPDDDARLRLWAGAWPPAIAVDEGVDRAALADRYRLSGGAVRNVAVYAAHLAAARAESVTAGDVFVALRREHAKLGVALEEAPI
jgi:hypothetical protein